MAQTAPEEHDWKIAHSSIEAIEIVKQFGIPFFIEFDHDLGLLPNGEEDTARQFLDWLFEKYPDAIETITGYSIHSRNPDGAKNIRAFMESWIKSRSL